MNTGGLTHSSSSLLQLRRVLVTGGTGFLGRHLVERLRAARIAVVTPSREQGFGLQRDNLPLNEVDHVFHLAARTGVVDAWDDPVGFFYTNTHGTVRVLDQCRRHGCSLTYISAYVYGQPQRLPIAEADPVVANNPYAFSKSMAEGACRFFSKNFGVPVTILRPFNVYGPGQSDRFLLPRIAAQVVDRNCHEIVVSDLAPRRDYIFVSDAIDAILVSLATTPGSLFNIGSGTSHSVADAIRTVCRIAGVTKPYRAIVTATRPNEIDDVVADISALRAQTGWIPRVSFDEGLRKLIEKLKV